MRFTIRALFILTTLAAVVLGSFMAGFREGLAEGHRQVYVEQGLGVVISK